MTDETEIRSFLALDPPEEILREIGRSRDACRKLIQGDIRWVRPEGIHLTLKFFGDIFAADVANIATVAEKAAARDRPFSSGDRRRGCLPRSAPSPCPLARDGRRCGKAARLSKEAGSGAPGDRFPREERPFRPHLTLARIKTSKGLIGLVRALEKGEEYTAGRFIASGLSLMQSELTPRGAIYTRLKWFPFAG